MEDLSEPPKRFSWNQRLNFMVVFWVWLPKLILKITGQLHPKKLWSFGYFNLSKSNVLHFDSVSHTLYAAIKQLRCWCLSSDFDSFLLLPAGRDGTFAGRAGRFATGVLWECCRVLWRFLFFFQNAVLWCSLILILLRASGSANLNHRLPIFASFSFELTRSSMVPRPKNPNGSSSSVSSWWRWNAEMCPAWIWWICLA